MSEWHEEALIYLHDNYIKTHPTFFFHCGNNSSNYSAPSNFAVQ